MSTAASTVPRADAGQALKDAVVTALISFALLLLLIGFKTVQNMRNELELETRIPLLLAIVAVITAHEPGRYRLSGVRLTYRLNGGEERVGEGIDTTFTVCADDPVPALESCED